MKISYDRIGVESKNKIIGGFFIKDINSLSHYNKKNIKSVLLKKVWNNRARNFLSSLQFMGYLLCDIC